MNVHPIRTDEDHAKALELLESVWGAAPGTPEADTAEVLATLIDAYERENHAIGPPDPVSAIRFRMQQQGFTTSDLAKVLGGRSKVSEVLRGKRGLSLGMIRRLHHQWGIPAAVLIGDGRAEAA